MPRYEKPQKGNPFQLVINQHTFPAKSIARFADVHGRVQLQMKAAKLLRRAKPNDHIFCARRAWDNDTETNFAKRFEDDFQRLADGVIDGSVSSIDPKQKHIITAFYALWT